MEQNSSAKTPQIAECYNQTKFYKQKSTINKVKLKGKHETCEPGIKICKNLNDISRFKKYNIQNECAESAANLIHIMRYVNELENITEIIQTQSYRLGKTGSNSRMSSSSVTLALY